MRMDDLSPPAIVASDDAADGYGKFAAQINSMYEAHEESQAAAEKSQAIAIEWAYKAGLKLIEMKARLPRGSWLSWVAKHLRFTDRTAARLMALARRDPKSDLKAEWSQINGRPVEQDPPEEELPAEPEQPDESVPEEDPDFDPEHGDAWEPDTGDPVGQSNQTHASDKPARPEPAKKPEPKKAEPKKKDVPAQPAARSSTIKPPTLNSDGGVIKTPAGEPFPPALQRLKDIFADPTIPTTAEYCRKAGEKAKAIMHSWAYHLEIETLGLWARLAELYEYAAPYAFCPRCKGHGKADGDQYGCYECKTAGWVPRWKFDEMQSEAKKGA